MADYTENLNLILPKKSENYDVEVANTNNRIIDSALVNKVEKVAGKALSTNDFTDGYKKKVDDLVEGIKGDSAYQIAVKNGYKGTEQEWIASLKGNKGDKGETGDVSLEQLENATKTMETTEVLEEITVKDSCESKLDLRISGNSVQEVEGNSEIRNCGDNINLLDIYNAHTEGYSITKNGVTYTWLDKGKIKLNGIADANHSIPFIGAYQSGDYIINLDGKYIQSGLADGVSLSYYNGTTKVTQLHTNEILDTKNEIDYVLLVISSGYTFDNVIIQPKLEKGTRATGYSKFDCGCVDIKVSTANLLECEKKYDMGAGASLYYTFGEIYLEANKQYYLKYNILNNSTKNTRSTPYLLKEGKFIYKSTSTSQNTTAGEKEWQFSVEESGFYTIGYWLHTSNIPVSIDNIMLTTIKEAGYVEHKEQTITFPLTVGQVLRKDDYLADDGIHHERKTIVLDGTENWVIGNSGTNINYQRFYVSLSDAKNNGINLLCSHLKEIYAGSNTIFHKDECGCNVSNGKYLQIKISKEIASTTDELKSYLAEQYANGTPITVEYELSDEEIEAYTEEQQEAYNKIKELYSYQGVTHITCEDEIKANMQLTYFINNEINKTYAKKIDEISSKQDKDKTEIEEKINTKQNKMTNTTAQLTVETYLGEIDINYVAKFGNVCRVDFRAKILSDIGDNVNFLKLPFIPTHSTVILFGVGERYEVSDMKWAYCDTEGNIKGNKLTAGNYIHMSFTYICQEWGE